MPTTAPYGSWKSPITSELIVSKNIALGGAFFAGEDIYWIEARPSEGGRQVLVRRTPGGQVSDVTPAPFNVRTRVHEYGGRCYAIHDGVLYFANFADQRLYTQKTGGEPQPLTPEAELRYADPIVDAARRRLICVREDHTQEGKEATNTLVSVSLADGARQVVLVSGHDFYSDPRLSPDGRRLCWLAWNHPNLPWDGTELYVAALHSDGSLGSPVLVAGGLEESIYQPKWSPDGALYFISDRSGWWNLYRWIGGEVEPLYPMEAEFGQPQWGFGGGTYDFASPEQMVCTYTQNGEWHLASLDLRSKELTRIDTPYTDIWRPNVKGTQVLFLGASPTTSSCVVQLDLSSGQMETLRRSSELEIDPGYLSLPQVIEFPTENGQTAFANFYPPKNKDYAAPAGERPPLIVHSHGGPTGSYSTAFSLGTQFWTSRGFAVVDVNYGGSTGYGREYRLRLNGQWGVVDVNDCANAARYLAAQGLVDGERLAISGGSAGGYTTLCALAFTDVFKAGASHFGIGDLETFVSDTHKFESRYLDRLVGPYPERKDLYYQRSAINYVDQIDCPVILFQGLEDKIVPPSQSETMFAAVRAKGLPAAYLPFEGEQHGFRKAENIQRSLEGELYFYARIFGFELAEPVEPVQIENLQPPS